VISSFGNGVGCGCCGVRLVWRAACRRWAVCVVQVSLAKLLSLGPQGVMALGVPRIDAKKLLKKCADAVALPDPLPGLLDRLGLVSHLAAIRQLAGGASLPRVLRLGAAGVASAGVAPADAAQLLRQVAEICDGALEVNGNLARFPGAASPGSGDGRGSGGVAFAASPSECSAEPSPECDDEEAEEDGNDIGGAKVGGRFVSPTMALFSKNEASGSP